MLRAVAGEWDAPTTSQRSGTLRFDAVAVYQSRMPCSSGDSPEKIVVQTTGEYMGSIERSTPWAPRSMMAAKF